MKKISDAFTYIFSDNEWFNKVLIGGFYFLLIPFGIGAVMLNGFLTEFAKGQRNGDRSMPYWRNIRPLFNTGVRNSGVFLLSVASVYTAIFFSVPFTIPLTIILVSVILTVNALYLTRAFDAASIIISTVILIIAISVGWMWIVVGWPLLIFLAMLVQVHLLGVKNVS